MNLKQTLNQNCAKEIDVSFIAKNINFHLLQKAKIDQNT